jgi:hypothetical protein
MMRKSSENIAIEGSNIIRMSPLGNASVPFKKRSFFSIF